MSPVSFRFALSVASALVLAVSIPAVVLDEMSGGAAPASGPEADLAQPPTTAAGDGSIPFLDDDGHHGIDAPDACVPGAMSPIELEPDMTEQAMVLPVVDPRDVFAFRTEGKSSIEVTLTPGDLYPEAPETGIPVGPVFWRLQVLGFMCDPLPTSTQPDVFTVRQTVSVTGDVWVNVQVSAGLVVPGMPTGADAAPLRVATPFCHPPCSAVGYQITVS